MATTISSSSSTWVKIFLFDLNISFPMIPAPSKLSENCYKKIYLNSRYKCPYASSFPSRLQIYVKSSDTVKDGKVYSSKSESAVIANNIFEYAQTVILGYYGIPISQQYFFKYDSGCHYGKINIDSNSTYKKNGYYNDNYNNYISVKNSVDEPITPSDPLQYFVNISPAFLVDPNLVIANFTALPVAGIGSQQFQPGTYTMIIPDLSGYTLQSNLTALSSVLKFSAPEGGEAVFPNTNVIYNVEIYYSGGVQAYISVENTISTTIPTTVIHPVVVDVPDTPVNYLLKYESGSITTFPAGNYTITFLSQEPGTQVLQQQVSLAEPADTLPVPDTTLTDVGLYDIQGFWDNGQPAPDTQQAFFVISNNVEVNCFLAGTKILVLNSDTSQEEYQTIEEIKPGTLIKTLRDGYVPLRHNVHKTIFNNPYAQGKNKLYVLSKNDYSELTQDLVITGGHSILVDELSASQCAKTLTYWDTFEQTDGKYKLLSVCNELATPLPHRGVYEIYDLVLESEDDERNYGIYANGLLTDSMSFDFFYRYSKMDIHNA